MTLSISLKYITIVIHCQIRSLLIWKYSFHWYIDKKGIYKHRISKKEIWNSCISELDYACKNKTTKCCELSFIVIYSYKWPSHDKKKIKKIKLAWMSDWTTLTRLSTKLHPSRKLNSNTYTSKKVLNAF